MHHAIGNIIGMHPLIAFAAERGVTATLHPSDSPMPTVPLAAAALGIAVEDMTKNVLFFVQGEPVLVIARGIQRVDDRKIAAHFGVGRKPVKLASGEQTLATTGFEAGCVPPFGHLTPIPTLIDAQTMELPRIYGGTSNPNVLISVPPHELLKIIEATVLELTLA
jgi:prolyl-tRNA editing enzyme YbaK/EbsC (Cys-tRNA(Pro) deacylase)